MTVNSRYRGIVRRVLATGLVGAAVTLIVSWFVGTALVAPSQRSVGPPPGDLNATSIQLHSESGAVIAGWHTRPEGGNGVVVLLHGIRSSRLAMVERARLLHAAGYSTVMIDLQGHGESTGDTITVGHLEKHDVRAAVEYARREHPGEPVGVIGVSLGGAAAVLASPLSVQAVVLESVFPSIHRAVHNRVAARLGPLAYLPATLLLLQLEPRLGVPPSELRPIDRLDRINCPLLVAAGSDDPHTTADETRTIFEAAKQPKELWMVAGARHEDLCRFDRDRYRERVIGFLNRHLAIEREPQ